MSFDMTKFRRAKLISRTAEVKVPELKDWFEEGAEPVMIVRGLTGEEFYNVREAVAKQRDLQTIASRLLSGQGEAMAEALEEFFGGVPDEYARRVEVLVAGCVEPKMDRPDALRFFKHFPSTAHLVADAILRATGEGSVAGESKGCGEIPASATTSTSPICAESASTK
jgi:hypothetical protein